MKISRLFDDPTVRAMLEQAERDQGDAAPVIAREPQPLPTPGAAASARRLFLAAGPARDVFAKLHAAADAERELEAA
jgi:hypothetical protein